MLALIAEADVLETSPQTEDNAMRRFLLCGSIDGKADNLRWLQRLAAQCKPDAILFAGGILDPETARHTTTDLSHHKVGFYETFFQTVGKLNVFAAIVPGPVDVPIRAFARIGLNCEIEFPSLHLVHASLCEQEGVVVAGVGGLLSEDRDTPDGVIRCSRTMAEYHLRGLAASPSPRKILLLWSCPTGVLGGAEGNRVAGDLIDSYQPTLCVVAGTTERRGSQGFAHTLVVNPGRLADGSAALVDFARPVDEQVEFLDIHAAQPAHAS